MDIREIEDGFSVTGQVLPNHIPAIAAAGFRMIICSRPDHEGPEQPAHAEIRDAAAAAGMSFAYIPLAMGAAPAQQPSRLAEALASSPGPVLGYCRSGARAASLFALAKAY
jgi:sulfide:quinone oxidoreductase